MAGKSKRQRKASFAHGLFSMFKRGINQISNTKATSSSDPWDEAQRVRKVYPSDEDSRYWVAEPGIDWRASVFIAKFHEARMSEVKTMAVQHSN